MLQLRTDAYSRYSGLELRHLRLIWTVAEERSLTRAAARLRLTPSALSHQLRAVEQIAGGAVMRSFRDDFPDVEVRIVAEATTRPVAALLAGEIDLAIAPETPVDQGLVVRPVLRDEMLFVMAPDHRLASRRWLEPGDIAREHLLAYSSRPEQSALCLEILRPAGLVPAKATSVRLTEAIIEMVRAGIGVASLAEWAVRPYVDRGAVVARRITRKGWLRTWNAITRPAPEAGAPVMAFVEHLATVFGAKRKLSRLVSC